MQSSAEKTQARIDLEYRAAAALELHRRRLQEKTVYGIVSPKHGLVRCWQESDGQYQQVDKKPIVQIPEKLEPFLIKKKRFKIAYGGRGAGKSKSFGHIFTSRAKDYGDKTLCLREIQNSIEDSVYAMLAGSIKELQFQNFDVVQNAIRLNGLDVFKFKGMARNPDAIKSMEGFKYSWVEEAQSASEESIKKLTPTIRVQDSEIWLSLNPESSEDPVYKRFIAPFLGELLKNGYYEDELHLVVLMNYWDNPWFPDTLNEERLWDKANMSAAYYAHVWEGETNDSIENALIKPEWFEACVDAHIKLGFQPRGMIMASHDPSDEGEDTKGYALSHGSVIIDVQEKESVDVNEGCDWATGLAINAQADGFTWDCDGMGAPLKRQVSQSFDGKHTVLSMFKGSEGVDFPDALYLPADGQPVRDQLTNKDVFRNKRAQYYGALRDSMFLTYRAVVHGEYSDPDKLLSISSKIAIINKLKAELCRMPIKPNGSGRLELYTKQEMKTKFKFDSPNLADSVMMLKRKPTMSAQKRPYIPKKTRAMGRR